MQYNGDREALKLLNEKYRNDALGVFISGLNGPLDDILFSSRPADLSTALALAQELEMNQQRYTFANAFANRNSGSYRMSHSQYRTAHNHERTVLSQPQPEPMDVDPSLSRLNNAHNNG